MNARAKETTLRFYKERLLCVLVHIQQHLDEPLALGFATSRTARRA
jgi:hypothetical protein